MRVSAHFKLSLQEGGLPKTRDSPLRGVGIAGQPSVKALPRAFLNLGQAVCSHSWPRPRTSCASCLPGGLAP